MTPSIHKMLQEHLERNLTDYLLQWEQIQSDLTMTTDEEKKILLQKHLEQAGLKTCLLGEQKDLLYGESPTHSTSKTPITLLLYTTCLIPLSARAIPGKTLPIAASLAALKLAEEITGHSPAQIKWLIYLPCQDVPLHLDPLIAAYQHLLQGSGCLWYDTLPTGPLHLTHLIGSGSKGFLHVALTLQNSKQPIHAHYGAIVPDAAWQLLWALNQIKDQREEILIEGFYDGIHTFEQEAFEQVTHLPDTRVRMLHTWNMEKLLLDLQNPQHYYAYFFTPTCNILNIDIPNESEAHISSTARADIGFYLVPEQDPYDIYTRLQHHLGNRGFQHIQTELINASYPTYTPTTNSFVQHVYQAGKWAYDDSSLHIVPLLAVRNSPAALSRKMNMPVVFIPEMELPQEDKTIHIREFSGQVKQIVLLLSQLSRLEESASSNQSSQ